MNSRPLEGKKVVFFHADIHSPGGSERLLAGVVKEFEKQGASTHIVTFKYNPEALFNESFQAKVHEVIGRGLLYSTPLWLRLLYFPRAVLALRKRLKKIRPDIIISRSPFESIYVYLATLFTRFSYVTHIHTTISWDCGDIRQFALIYRKAMKKITRSTAGHREFTPKTPPKANPVKRLISELAAIVEYRAVRKAKKIFVLSNQMKWETSELYHRDAVVVKGALSSEILSYKPGTNMKERLGLAGKRILLTISRLTTRKRVSLVIKAFERLSRNYDDLVLVIGGRGPEEDNLKKLANELGIGDRIRFLGFVPDSELWDYYASGDVFVHVDWADFGIVPYEVLALQKKVVWSTEIETDDYLRQNRHVFSADPTIESLSETLERALAAEVTEPFDMSPYTWKRYADGLIRELLPLITTPR